MFLFGKKQEQPISGQLEIDLILSIRKAIEKATFKMFEFKLDENPKIEQKPTVTWEGQMKLSKPSDCTFISVVTMERPDKNDNGIFVLFIPDSVAIMIAGMKGKKTEEGAREICGEYLTQIVETFKEYLIKLGYESITFGVPMNFSYKVSELFPYYRSTKYEIIFSHKKEKFVQAEVGIGPLKKDAQS